jgi:hypothetical protein
MLDLEACKKHIGRFAYMSIITMLSRSLNPRVKEVRRIVGVNEENRSVVLGPGFLLEGSNIIKRGVDGTYDVPADLLDNLVPLKLEALVEEYDKNRDYLIEGEVL